MSNPHRVSLFSNIKLDVETGCWNWTGSVWKSTGYGRLSFLGRQHGAHRVSAHVYLGYDLASPLRILHHCDNKRCFNPKHLYIGTLVDNARDCVGRGRHAQKKKTHCPKGHPYSGDNLHTVSTDGTRKCRQCCREASLRYKGDK